MRLIRLLLFFCFFTVMNIAFARQDNRSRFIEDKLGYPGPLVFNGPVAGRLDSSIYNRILFQDVDRLLAPFRNRTEERCWQSEFWGKWFTSAVLAYRYKPQPALKAKLDLAVSGLIKTQSKDGYIGNYIADKHLEHWDIWGRKYCMLGLLSYYDLTGDHNSVKAAKGIADHLIKELKDKNVNIVQKGRHRGMAATSVLEPMVLLYRATLDKKYLHFAEEIVRQWELPIGPGLISKARVNVGNRFPMPSEENWFGYEQGQKAYEMMSCYEGLLELFRVTGKESYKLAVQDVWQNIKDTEINIVGSGAMKECWFEGKPFQALVSLHYQETCVTATWIKLSQQLLRLTGEAKYADAIEKTYYNSLLAATTVDGSSWAVYSPILGIRSMGEDQCKMGINCCIASGPRALFTLPLTCVMKEKEGVYVNFFNPGSYSLKTPSGQQLEVIQLTEYPAKEDVEINFKLPHPEKFKLNIRIPEWSLLTTLSVNNKPLKELVPGSYVTIERSWSSDDVIRLKFDFRGRLEVLDGLPNHLAVRRGPIVLARDKRMTGEIDIDEIITPIVDEQGIVPLMFTEKSLGKDIWMSFRIPCRAGSYRVGASGRSHLLEFCDYASAGNTYSEESRFRVWLPQLIVPKTIKNYQHLPD